MRCRLWIGGGTIFSVKRIEGPPGLPQGRTDEEGKEVAAKKLDGLGPFVLVGFKLRRESEGLRRSNGGRVRRFIWKLP